MVAETYRKYRLFGSEVEFFLDASEVVAEPIMDEAYVLALKLQKIFNIYDENSEISALNRNKKITASPELVEVLKKAMKL